MSFAAKMITDSVNDFGQRLSTVELTYPRFIHAEIMTHRDRARNSASSRAIPWPKMMERITNDPVVPIKWGMEKPGMQAGEELPDHLAYLAKGIWLAAKNQAVMYAQMLHNIGASWNEYRENPDKFKELGIDQYLPEFFGTCNAADPNIKVHKSLPNRITEPWMWITVVMTATNWKNLFRLRLHGDAEVHFQELMKHLQECMEASIPRKMPFGDWHTPYLSEDEKEDIKSLWHDIPDIFPNRSLESMPLQISTARCARVSYLTQDGKRDFAKDLELFDRLVQGSGFGHWSPHEHVAMSSSPDERSGPYRGWKQFRKLFANESAD